MNVQVFAEACAIIAIVATVGYAVLGFFGIRTLQDIRNHLNEKPPAK